jgi:DNA-binding winged helix-turn-helix (wHTH) protein
MRALIATVDVSVAAKRQSESTIQTGKLLVNLDTRVVLVDDRPVRLTGKEYGILELLSLRKGTTLTKEIFLNHLYGGMDEPELKIIDVFVCKLRKKLAQATGGEHHIETVWGRGYVLRDPAAMPAATIVVAPEDLGARDTRVAQRPPRNVSGAKRTGEVPKLDNRSVSSQNDQRVVEKSSAITGLVGAAPRELGLTLSRDESRMRFEDAVTNDGGPLHLPRPDPEHS